MYLARPEASPQGGAPRRQPRQSALHQARALVTYFTVESQALSFKLWNQLFTRL